MTPLDRMRLEQDAKHLHQLGPRVIAEMLAELPQHAGSHVRDVVQKYAQLTPALVAWCGADRFPPRPLRELPR